MTCHLGSPVLSCRAPQGALWLVSPTLAYRLSRQSLHMRGVSDSKGICIQSNVPNTNTHLADGLLVAHLCISGERVAVYSDYQILKGPCSRGSSESGGDLPRKQVSKARGQFSLVSLLRLSLRSGCEHPRPKNTPNSTENFHKDTYREHKKCIVG